MQLARESSDKDVTLDDGCPAYRGRMNADILIRPPVASDIEALAVLHVSTWRDTYSGLVPESFYSGDALETRRRMWSRSIDEDRADRIVRLAEIDSAVVGFAAAGAPAAGDAPRSLQLFMLYLSKDHHGSGAGQALLDAVIGEKPAFLWVAKENPRARAFYGKNRFIADGVEQVHPMAEGLIEIRLIR